MLISYQVNMFYKKGAEHENIQREDGNDVYQDGNVLL